MNDIYYENCMVQIQRFAPTTSLSSLESRAITFLVKNGIKELLKVNPEYHWWYSDDLNRDLLVGDVPFNIWRCRLSNKKKWFYAKTIDECVDLALIDKNTPT